MVTVLIHPTANYRLKRAPKRRLDALLRRLEEYEDPLIVLPKTRDKSLIKGETVYDGWHADNYVKRGIEEIARVVDKKERIELGGLFHHSCVYGYAWELRKFHGRKVTIKENLTDAALWPVHDTLDCRSYQWLLEAGVDIDPPPVKRMFYVALTRTHSKMPASEDTTYHRTQKEAAKELRKKATSVDGMIITTEVLYASGLKLG